MNTSIFSFQRFGLVTKKYYAENGKMLMMRLLVCFCLMSGIFIIGDYNRMAIDNEIMQSKVIENKYYYVNKTVQDLREEGMKKSNKTYEGEIYSGFAMMVIFALVLASNFMEHTYTRPERTAFLTLPATHLEKFAIRWLTYVPLIILTLCLMFVCADLIRTCYFHIAYPALPNVYHLDYAHISDSFDKKSFVQLATLALLFHSLYILGSTIWNRGSLVKTSVALIIIMLLLVAVGSIFDAMHISLLGDRATSTNGGLIIVDIKVFPIFLCIATVINWYIAYLRCKEKEIIHRIF